MKSLVQVFDLLELIKEESSVDNKISLIEEYQSSKLFMKVLRYALDSRLVFNIGTFPAFKERSTKGKKPDAKKIFKFLDYLAHKPGATKKDKEALFALISHDAKTYEVVKRICKKDLRCGVSVKRANKALGNVIFDIPYCRCSTEKSIDRVTMPAIIQEKADSMFVNMFVDDKGRITFRSRNGNKVKQLKKLKKAIRGQLPEEARGKVYTGELLVTKARGVIFDRKTGNGILTSCIYGTAEQKMADCAFLKVWDVVDITDFWEGVYKVPYELRFNTLSSLVDLVGLDQFQLIETSEVSTIEEAYDFFKRMRSEGKEGAVLKDKKMIWKYHTSPLQIKLKNVMDAELVITGIYKGDPDKKYAECLGGISCESSCGKLKVNVGTGFSDDLRGYRLTDDGDIDLEFTKKQLKYWEDQIGRIAQLECESIIKDKNKDTYSLFLPRFSGLRDDKKKADSLKDLQER